jgi:hypothetical protein
MLMAEFMCPNGKMSINGVCPMFDNDVTQQTDAFQNNPFKFDFQKETTSSKKSAFDLISQNVDAYEAYVEEKLGISKNAQQAMRLGASAFSALSGGSIVSVVGPFAIPFIAGGAIRAAENNRIQNLTMQDPQGTINTINLQKAPKGSSYSIGGIGTSAGVSRDPAGTGGGSRQATSAGATNTGRTDGGWGW